MRKAHGGEGMRRRLRGLLGLNPDSGSGRMRRRRRRRGRRRRKRRRRRGRWRRNRGPMKGPLKWDR